jgi:prepilin-type N-terminal cleavage/methylation domain-containing protein
MTTNWSRIKGFTLIEIAIVLLIVSILLGYTVALFPVQQELKQYRAVDKEMDEIIDAIYAYAQVNDRLPCAATVETDGLEDLVVVGENCNTWYGFLPAKTLGIDGRYNEDNLLQDPWGNPYRYQVTDNDTNANANGGDFVIGGDMAAVKMTALKPNLEICTEIPTKVQTACDTAAKTVATGIPAVVLSLGKDGATEPAVSEIQLENTDNSATDTVFVKSTISAVDTKEFDDIIKWIAPNTLYSKMIDAGHLP